MDSILLADGRQAIDFSPADMQGDVAILPLSVAQVLAERVPEFEFSVAKREILSRLMDCKTKAHLISEMKGFILFDQVISNLRVYTPDALAVPDLSE